MIFLLSVNHPITVYNIVRKITYVEVNLSMLKRFDCPHRLDGILRENSSQIIHFLLLIDNLFQRNIKPHTSFPNSSAGLESTLAPESSPSAP
jgi:hypothetical protein